MTGRFGNPHDEQGDAWLTEDRRRAEAVEVYDAPPPLPDWHHPPELPDWIERPLGRYCYGRHQRLVHDLHAVTPECRLAELTHDGGVVFIHFAAELEAAVPDGVEPCVACMEVDR